MTLKNDKTNNISMGKKGFIAEANAWTEEQKEYAKQLPSIIDEQNIKTIRVCYSDQHGVMRGKSLSVENFMVSLENGVAETVANLGKDTSNMPVLPILDHDGGFGVQQMGGGGDMILVPDPMTFKVLPWTGNSAWIISDLYLKDHSRCPFDCRHVMRQALDLLKDTGHEIIVGLELEFYVFNIDDPKLALSECGHPPEPPTVSAISHGYQYHAEDRIDNFEPLTDQLREMICALDLPMRTIEVEWGPGQFEVTFNPIAGLAAADALLLFRSAVKSMMRRQGRLASFMAKPALPNLCGSGWHLHQSLQATDSATNAFSSGDKQNLLSDTGRHYLAGLVEHAAGATIFSNPTINGYKRLGGSTLAPDRILWSHDNRGAMLRLIGGYGDEATRIENRSGEPCANPYLYMASQIYSGLDGIKNKLEPGEPTQGNPYDQHDKPLMPNSLMEAVEALDKSSALRAGFGDQFVDYYLGIKRAEIGRFLSHVTDWEHKEYFEMY